MFDSYFFGYNFSWNLVGAFVIIALVLFKKIKPKHIIKSMWFLLPLLFFLYRTASGRYMTERFGAVGNDIYSYFVEHNRYWNLFGILVILAIAVLCSNNRKIIKPKLIINALLLQLAIGFLALRTASGHYVLEKIAAGVNNIYACADEGSRFMFGNLINAEHAWGFIFAFKVLPIIIFFSACMSLLFHWGIIQRSVYYVSLIMRPLLGTSGAETLCAIANSFLGQTEAPLLVKHYLGRMTKSEILVVMVSGMATISGAILTVFVIMGVPAVHLLTASVMAIPGSILIAKILYPEEEVPTTLHGVMHQQEETTSTMFSAIATGTVDGLSLALNVGAMLIVFLSLLAGINVILESSFAYLNYGLQYAHIPLTLPIINLSYLFSYIFAPFGYLLGFSGQEALHAGQLLGIKVTVNELIAYKQMMTMNLSARSSALLTYALCGFANFSCIGIQIGGIGALVPEKRAWLCQLGFTAVLGASLANLLSAMIAGLLL